ncbi:acetyl-CoA carboxylase, carboxyltransferase subunit beta, partial [candidate division KSB1 bacterium]
WFKRVKEGFTKSAKKDIPEGLWIKCEGCNDILYKPEIEKNMGVCSKCQYHFKISSHEYMKLLLDEGSFEEMDADLKADDPLKFKDTKKYTDRLKAAQKKTNLNEAILTGYGRIENRPVVIGVMNFAFIGGSMGSVVGEKVKRAIDCSFETGFPLIIVSATGGARMMEGILSLMQMAKTSARLAKLNQNKGLYISILTNPTTAGVMASYAMLGDIIIAEPDALIGFAGPRVIKGTIGEDLPEGFQKSDFVKEHGFVDMVVNRHKLRERLTEIFNFFYDEKQQETPPDFTN